MMMRGKEWNLEDSPLFPQVPTSHRASLYYIILYPPSSSIPHSKHVCTYVSGVHNHVCRMHVPMYV
jgi:hypothetical protein